MVKYDLEIAMPCSNNDKYGKRLESFKKNGLLNVGTKYKILLSLLIGTEDIPDLKEGWPANITIRVIKSDKDHCAAKVYDYYSKYPLEEIDSVKWFMRVDDDSLTNVDNLMDLLSKYDHQETYYMSTEFVEGNAHVEYELVREMGLDVRFPLMHEIEACIVSQKCFFKILSNPTVKKLFYRRAQIEDGYTDMCLALAADVCRIIPSSVFFLTCEPNCLDFLRGARHHIHLVAPDVNPHVYYFLTNIVHNIGTEIADQVFVIGQIRQGIIERSLITKFVSNGTLLPESYDEALWLYDSKNKILNVFNGYLELTSKFHVENKFPIPYTEGEFLLDRAKSSFIKSLFDEKDKQV